LPEQSATKARLEPHHLQILVYIQEHGSITQREYGDISARSLASRKLDFEKLLQLNLIEVKGLGRGTYYVLVSSR
jgi:predicted HTH transcriptional regulator